MTVRFHVALRLALALTYLGLELYQPARSLGASVLPFVLVFFLAAQTSPPADGASAPPAAHGIMFAFHVTLSILAYAGVCHSLFVLSLIFSGRGTPAPKPQTRQTWCGGCPRLSCWSAIMSSRGVLVGLVSIAIGNSLGIRLGRPLKAANTRLRSEVSNHTAGYSLYMCSIFAWRGQTAWRGARASNCASQFCGLWCEFYGRKSISLA